MARPLRKPTTILVLLVIALALPMIASHGIGSHGTSSTTCQAAATMASGSANAYNHHETGSRSYAIAEVKWLDTTTTTDEDGPHEDPVATEADATVMPQALTDWALASYSHAYGEHDWGGGDDSSCLAQFDWVSYGTPDFESFPSSLQEQILSVSCSSSTQKSAYAYSGEVYYNANTNSTYLWQGRDGVDLTATPELNTDSAIVTSISSQAVATGLQIDAYGSGSWGCKMEFGPTE